MRLLRTISNTDFGHPDADKNVMIRRDAARAVILDSHDNVAILSVKVGSYHKIPGGGVEEGEDIYKALAREVKEETGSAIEVIDEIGYILEYRESIKQYSYGYLCRLNGAIGDTDFTKKEIRDGFQPPVWLPIDEAIDTFNNDKPEFLRAEFMSLRDRTFLESARILLNK